nr:endonuclease domain-containing protein [Desulfobulbaceae bacterium]
MTDTEQLLWQCLRRSQLGGFKFRRQHPIGKFIVDFFCVSSKLAVELDGGQHGDYHIEAYDSKRTLWLNSKGIRVLRFWNNEILQNLPEVLAKIWYILHNPPTQNGCT